MTKQEIKEMKKRGYYTIPILKLEARYYIDKNCNIVDTFNDVENALIYKWDPLTAMNPINIYLSNGDIRVESPARLYMITYYGYFEADIYDIGYGVPSTRYQYIITTKEKLPNNTLILNNDIFKYSYFKYFL